MSEKRLIDANALKVVLKIDHPKDFSDGFKAWDLSNIRKTIDEAPTIDAVEIVPCKDCANCTHDAIGYADDKYVCDTPESPFCNWGVHPNDFCSYGKRRESKVANET